MTQESYDMISFRPDQDIREAIDQVRKTEHRSSRSDTIRFLIRLGFQFWQQRQPHVMGQAQQGA